MVSEARDGKRSVPVDDSKLFAFEQAELKRFGGGGKDEEVFLFASSPSSIILSEPAKVKSPRKLLVLVVNGDKGTLRSESDFGEKRSQRDLTADEVRAIQKFAKTSGADDLERLEWARKVGGKGPLLYVAHGTQYVYLHLSSASARRVWINNPPVVGDTEYAPDDPLWKYSKVVDFLSGFSKAEKNDR